MNVCVGEWVDGCVDKQVGGSYDKTNGEKPIERLPEKGAAAHEGKHSDRAELSVTRVVLISSQGFLIRCSVLPTERLFRRPGREAEKDGHGDQRSGRTACHRARGVQLVQQHERGRAGPDGHRAEPGRQDAGADRCRGGRARVYQPPTCPFLPLDQVSEERPPGGIRKVQIPNTINPKPHHPGL